MNKKLSYTPKQGVRFVLSSEDNVAHGNFFFFRPPGTLVPGGVMERIEISKIGKLRCHNNSFRVRPKSAVKFGPPTTKFDM